MTGRRTNIVELLFDIIQRKDPNWIGAINAWRCRQDRVENADPKIGDVVVVFNDDIKDYNLGILADCKDTAMEGWPANLKWKLKGSLDWWKHCRRLKISDLNTITGFAVDVEGGLENEH